MVSNLHPKQLEPFNSALHHLLKLNYAVYLAWRASFVASSTISHQLLILRIGLLEDDVAFHVGVQEKEALSS